MKKIASLFCLIVIAGCAATPTPKIVAQADTVCERSYRTGSAIAKDECTTAQEREQKQQAVEQMRDSIQRARATSTTSPAG